MKLFDFSKNKPKDIDFFINYYETIPEEKWCAGRFSNEEGQNCAIGLLGVDGTFFHGIEKTELFESLCKLVPLGSSYGYVDYPEDLALANNGKKAQYQQPTPKQRTLAYLNDIKNKTLN